MIQSTFKAAYMPNSCICSYYMNHYLVTKQQCVPKKKFSILKEPSIDRMVTNISYVTANSEKVQDMGKHVYSTNYCRQ